MNVSTSTVQPRRKRAAARVQEEENAATLQLGPEFETVQVGHDGSLQPLIALNLSEARILINAALRERRKEFEGLSDDAIDDETLIETAASSNEAVQKSMEYLNMFARFRDEQTVGAVESLLKSPENKNLHPFEIAQLGTLSCDDADEAKTLIPSLVGKKTDEELQALLDQLGRLETPTTL